MLRTVSTILGSALLLWTLVSSPLAAQQTSDEVKEEIRALQESVKALQKEVQEIRAQLSRQAPQSSAIGAVIDVADKPVRGASTAVLTLVEFSDYQ